VDVSLDYVLVVVVVVTMKIIVIIIMMMMTQLEDFTWSPYSNFSWKKSNLNIEINN
jgi:hypothetical protein